MPERSSRRFPRSLPASTRRRSPRTERAFERGATEFELLEGVGRAEGDLPIVRFEPDWGYETQPIGGFIPDPGNSVWNDLSASRTGLLPVLHGEKCIHCGVCDLVCPDLCLVWGDGAEGGKFKRELKGVDYRYCKGCLRCVESCADRCADQGGRDPGSRRPAARAAVPRSHCLKWMRVKWMT